MTIEKMKFNGTFRDYQQRVIDNSDQYLKDGKINIVAAPGSGKTVLGLELIRKLGKPCIIFSPTAAIREQWGYRLRDLFLEDKADFPLLFSSDPHDIKPITSITYQSLYTAVAKISEKSEEGIDCSDMDIFKAVKENGIKTICLDEAHHLKNEWQKALEKFINGLNSDVKIISLTATPPYDSDASEWERYINVCGEIDEEIFIPELVAQNTLCPHQDYVYFNFPSSQEAETIKAHRQNAAAALDEMGKLGFWEEISKKAGVSPAPSLLYEDLSLAKRVLRDMVQAETRRIVVDSQEVFEELKCFAETYAQAALPLLELYTGEESLFETQQVEAELQKALERRVPLKSGGYIVVDCTEAMTTIDVNTGGFVGKRDFSETVFKTNLEAAKTIARQLRLRNLGGIIIIDFIDMQSSAHKAAVLEELRRAASTDRTKLTISEFTELGLVEMTRKRTRESLSHTLCEPCPLCGGRGEIKTARTICYEIMREIVRLYRQYDKADSFKILASQSVIDFFLEDEAPALELLQNFVQKPVHLEAEPAYTQEQYDVLIG